MSAVHGPLGEDELIDALRESPGIPRDQRAALWSRISASVGVLPGSDGSGGDDGGGVSSPDAPASGSGSTSAAGTTAATTVSAKIAALTAAVSLAVGAAAGSVVTYLAVGSAPEERALVMETTAVEPEAVAPEIAAPELEEPSIAAEIVEPAIAEPAIAEPAIARAARPPVRPRIEEAEEPTETTADRAAADRAAERALLRQAQSAMARGRPLGALDALATHRQRYPESTLAEERMALEVAALRAAGREERAALLRDDFLRRYPSSIFRELVEPGRSGNEND